MATAKSTAPVVRFPNGNEIQVFRASRPEVLSVLKKANVEDWGWWLEFHGTPEELIAAGAATPEMFEGIRKSGQKTHLTPYGDKCTVKICGKGRFHLTLRLHDELESDPCRGRDRKKVWREVGPAVDQEVASVLERMRAPRRTTP